jgi:WD40 repeat protein
MALTGQSDGTIASWRMAPTPVRAGTTYRGLGSAVAGLAAGGRFLVGIDRDAALVTWPLGQGHGPAAQHLERYRTDALAVAWSPDGTLASAGRDGAIQLVSAAGQHRRLTTLSSPVTALAWTSAQQLVVGSEDGSVTAWSPAGTRQRILAPPSQVPFAGLVADKDGDLAYALSDGRLTVLPAGGAPAIHVTTPPDVHAVALSPDGHLVAVASGEQAEAAITLIPVSGGPRQTLRGHRLQVDSLAFSPDSRTLASGSDDHTIRLWSTKTGAVLAVLTGHTDMVQSLAFTPDGRLLSSGGQDGTIRLWDVKQHSQVGRPLRYNDAFVRALATSQDGSRLAAANGRSVISWPFAPAGWTTAACTLAARELTPAEWERYAHRQSGQRLCPDTTR